MRRYLIVDDNRDLAENLAEIVRDEGAEVHIASGAAAALALGRAHRFDAVVTDMRMPVMSGAELVHALRSIDPGLPAIVITAYTRDDDLLAARREGLLAVLPKPVPVERLLALLPLARRDGLVAIVEDDAALADNLTEALRERGFAAMTASSVLETKRLGAVRPFVALADMRVPVGPPGEAMRRLADALPGLPIVVVTAFEEAPPVPYVALFTKPFDTGALLDTITRIYEETRR